MNILIIDDEPTITEFFSRLATAQGHPTPDTVGSGEEALTQVLRKPYDLITLDIKMPGVSGLEIVAMLRNMNPHAIVAVISGFIPTELAADMANCVDVLMTKPVGIEPFNRLLASAATITATLKDLRQLGIPPTTLS